MVGIKKHGVPRRNGQARNAQMPVNKAGIPPAASSLGGHAAPAPIMRTGVNGERGLPYPVGEQAGMPTHLAK